MSRGYVKTVAASPAMLPHARDLAELPLLVYVLLLRMHASYT